MNLIENIHRINSLISEDKKEHTIRTMIDKHGLETTFKMVEDYDLIDSYLIDEDKINYIKDEFVKVNDGNYVSMEQIWQRPIWIKIDDEGEIHQIEGLHKNIVSVVKHKEHGAGVSKYYPKYEELSPEIIDKLFRIMLGQYIKI